MARWHNVYADGHAHFCTATVVGWRDMLVGPAVDVLYEEWQSARALLDVKVLAYVVMPNHMHVVLWAERGESISKFLLQTLSLSARRVCSGGLWKERPRVVPVYSAAVLRAKVDYLHRNPLRKGLVINPDEWQHSSFRQLELGECSEPFQCDDWGLINLS